MIGKKLGRCSLVCYFTGGYNFSCSIGLKHAIDGSYVSHSFVHDALCLNVQIPWAVDDRKPDGPVWLISQQQSLAFFVEIASLHVHVLRVFT